MSEYQLEIKQIVDYSRRRIYRQFIQLLLKENDSYLMVSVQCKNSTVIAPLNFNKAKGVTPLIINLPMYF